MRQELSMVEQRYLAVREVLDTGAAMPPPASAAVPVARTAAAANAVTLTRHEGRISRILPAP